MLCTSVPSRAPTNVRAQVHGLDELLVEWEAVPQEYVNGHLLGYIVFYKRNGYYYPEYSVNTSSPDVLQVLLKNLQSGEGYQVAVAAFTSKGEGPRSYRIYRTIRSEFDRTPLLFCQNICFF